MTEARITGSFFDVCHPNVWNTAYWGDVCRFWGDTNWRALIGDMHDIGIDTIILSNVAFWGRPLFPGYENKIGLPLKMTCSDPLEVCAAEADRLGMKMFFGIGLRGRVSQIRDYADMRPPWPEEWFQWNTALAEAILDRFGSRTGFAGFYIPYEIDFIDYQLELYEKWIRGYLRPAIGRVPVLISPGNLGDHPNLDELPRQLERTDIQILAPQDYGGRGWDMQKDAMEFVRKNAEALTKAAPMMKNIGVSLWSNCEVFDHIPSPDGRVYNVAGPFQRIRRQMELQAPLVEKLICFQYQGIMNRHSDLVNIGRADTDILYRDYVDYLRRRTSRRRL
ncbi:MAG: DUF4434 domain-containing protein [Phycisphaerae bacterium]